jgi:hypothetical protein
MQTKCIECGKHRPLAAFRTARVCKRCHRTRLRMDRRLRGRDQASPSVEDKSL